MKKVIKNKETKEVKLVLPGDADVKIQKDKLGKPVIFVSNYPHGPKTVGNTRYLGGTYYCDPDVATDAMVVDEVPDENVPADVKEKKYKVDKDTKQFEEVEEVV